MFDLKGWQTAREETRDTRREENTFRGDFQTLADKNWKLEGGYLLWYVKYNYFDFNLISVVSLRIK